MSASGLSPIQAALYALFVGDGTLMALIDGVFDDIPEGTETKYIVLGDATEVPFLTFGFRVGINSARGHTGTFSVDVWTKDDVTSAGYKVAQTIIDRMTEIIEANSLVVAGHTTVTAEYKRGELLRSVDARTNEMWRHGVAMYDITVQDT